MSKLLTADLASIEISWLLHNLVPFCVILIHILFVESICCLRPMKAHTNRLASRSVQFGQLPLLFILPPVPYLNLLPANFSVRASSCTGWFEPYLVPNPKDRFSRDRANFMNGIDFLVQT